MTFRLRVPLLAALGLGLTMAGCQEQLTAPGSCPATCPGGTPVVRDTILDAVTDGDSTYEGFIVPGTTGGGVRLSNGFNGVTDLGLVRFGGRPDSLIVKDTARTYTIDSVEIVITLLKRDTTASGLLLEVHRVPTTIDSNSTYADLSPLIVAGTLLDSATIVDSVRPGSLGFSYHFAFSGAALSQVDIPPADSGVLVLALALSGGTTSGVRIGGGGSGSAAPLFRTFVTVNIADTTTSVRQRVIQPSPVTRYLSSVSPANDPDLLTLGTSAGARALIRFPFPAYLKDSALISRATLELTPADTIRGLSGDSAFVKVNGLVADFGPKSPPSGSAGAAGSRALIFGSVDTVRVEVGGEIKNWQRTTLPHPAALLLSLAPEGASFTEPQFKSTRPGAGRPRLHITYQLPFPFERP